MPNCVENVEIVNSLCLMHCNCAVKRLRLSSSQFRCTRCCMDIILYLVYATKQRVVISYEHPGRGRSSLRAAQGPKFKIPSPISFVPRPVPSLSGLGTLGFWKCWHRTDARTHGLADIWPVIQVISREREREMTKRRHVAYALRTYWW